MNKKRNENVNSNIYLSFIIFINIALFWIILGKIIDIKNLNIGEIIGYTFIFAMIFNCFLRINKRKKLIVLGVLLVFLILNLMIASNFNVRYIVLHFQNVFSKYYKAVKSPSAIYEEIKIGIIMGTIASFVILYILSKFKLNILFPIINLSVFLVFKFNLPNLKWELTSIENIVLFLTSVSFLLIISEKSKFKVITNKYSTMFVSVIIIILLIPMCKNIDKIYKNNKIVTLKVKYVDNMNSKVKELGNKINIFSDKNNLYMNGNITMIRGEGAGIIGGSVRSSNAGILKLQSDKPYYLKSSTFTEYLDKKWTSTKDYGDLTKNSEGYFEKEIFPNLELKQLSITPIVKFSDTMLYPNGIKDVNFKSNDNIDGFLLYEGSSTASIRGELNSEYNINFLDCDSLIEGVFSYNYGKNVNAIKEYENISNCLKISQYFNDKYSTKDSTAKIPDFLKSDIDALAKEIIGDETRPLEQIELVVKYFKDNYKYNLNVKTPPKDENFLLYFLNETKEGYCTYFATSTALLLRSLGFNTRYVEGYSVTGPGKSVGNEKHEWDVKAKDAHAWCEVGMPTNKKVYENKEKNYVWMVVDSTPSVERENSYRMMNLYQEDNSKDGIDKEKEEVNADKVEDINKEKEKKKEKEEELKEEEKQEIVKEKKLNYSKIIKYFATIIIVIFLINIRKIYIRIYGNYKTIYKYFIKNLRWIGLDIKESLTGEEIVALIQNLHLKQEFDEVRWKFYNEEFNDKKTCEDKMQYYKHIKKLRRKECSFYKNLILFFID